MVKTILVSNVNGYSQSMSRMTSISDNEMNIRIPLCNVQHLNRTLFRPPKGPGTKK